MSAPTPLATPEDVESLIETEISYDEISVYLEHAADDNRTANDVAQMSQFRQKRIEALLAAIKIKGYRDRSVASGGTANSSVTFESNKLQELKSELAQIDPSGRLTVDAIRDGSRHVRTTGDE